jgi:hypothetical protein
MMMTRRRRTVRTFSTNVKAMEMAMTPVISAPELLMRIVKMWRLRIV